MKFELIQPGAVLVAAVSVFLVGGLWYSPLLFGRAWMRANGFTEVDVADFNKTRTFGGSAVLALIMSLNLAVFLAAEGTNMVWGAMAGALAGLGWVAAGGGIVALFENRSWTYLAIHAGYHLVSFSLMGAILGAWR
ncbi:MAG: DUF1761 domain-containing protein [Verrucomicrobia bacterium]|nr:DUF1761 domain-containing protein [Verrucomicrobiota bacterium]